MVINELVKDCMLSKKKAPRYAYVAPYLVQAKQVAWDYLKEYSHKIPGIKINEAELKIDYPNGGRIQVLGADNAERLRGIYLDGVVLDEYADIKPSVFPEIIRPALSDRKGFAIFIGTPKGKNHFYELYEKAHASEEWYFAEHKASETGYVATAEIQEARKLMSEDQYMQEFECSFDAAIRGAFYSEEIKEARANNRICNGVYEPALDVHTAWDIGYRDDTSIVFFQLHGKEIRVVDFHTDSGKTVAEYAQVLKSKPYTYGSHYFPWDARIGTLASGGKSVLDVAREYGINAEILPNINVLDGINQARLKFPRMYFEKDTTQDFLNALSQYRREFDEKKNTFRSNPLHDWTSHPADAFRYMAISIADKADIDDSEYMEAVDAYIRSDIHSNNF